MQDFAAVEGLKKPGGDVAWLIFPVFEIIEHFSKFISIGRAGCELVVLIVKVGEFGMALEVGLATFFPIANLRQRFRNFSGMLSTIEC